MGEVRVKVKLSNVADEAAALAGRLPLGLQQARFFDVKIKKLEMAMNIG
jgi:hypothetical protein